MRTHPPGRENTASRHKPKRLRFARTPLALCFQKKLGVTTNTPKPSGDKRSEEDRRTWLGRLVDDDDFPIMGRVGTGLRVLDHR